MTMGGRCKLDVEIPSFVLQAVGVNARPMVNFCGYVVRTMTLMAGGSCPSIFAKYGTSMWLQVKNKFDIKDSDMQLSRLQAFANDIMQHLYQFWKARLHTYYKECGDTHEEREKKTLRIFRLKLGNRYVMYSMMRSLRQNSTNLCKTKIKNLKEIIHVLKHKKKYCFMFLAPSLGTHEAKAMDTVDLERDYNRNNMRE